MCTQAMSGVADSLAAAGVTWTPPADATFASVCKATCNACPPPPALPPAAPVPPGMCILSAPRNFSYADNTDHLSLYPVDESFGSTGLTIAMWIRKTDVSVEYHGILGLLSFGHSPFFDDPSIQAQTPTSIISIGVDEKTMECAMFVHL